LSRKERRVSVGRVGRAHGLDGSFYVEGPAHPLEVGTQVVVRGEPRRIERRGGTERQPLVRLSGVANRDAAVGLGGELLLVPEGASPLTEGEWLAEDLVGMRVEGLGPVRRVLDAPSCPVLELEDGTLVPFVEDAIVAVEPESGVIRADLGFLGVGQGS
jgi:16S rRNA processing protein RimM